MPQLETLVVPLSFLMFLAPSKYNSINAVNFRQKM